MESSSIREEAYPAATRKASGAVNRIPTEVSSMSFADKILVTISQEGRLSQWIQVPLSAPSSAAVDMALPSANLGSLPSLHLTPKTLVGGGGEDRETLGHLYAAQIASLIAMRDPDDKRTLVLALGFEKVDTERETFFDVLELVQKVL